MDNLLSDAGIHRHNAGHEGGAEYLMVGGITEVDKVACRAPQIYSRECSRRQGE